MSVVRVSGLRMAGCSVLSVARTADAGIASIAGTAGSSADQVYSTAKPTR